MRLSPVVKIILIINCVFYCIEIIAAFMSGGKAGNDWFSAINALHPIGYPGFSPHQYISYMFIHGGFMHLFFNMWQLFIFGTAIEETYGSKRFALYYLLCGVGSAVANQLCTAIGLISPALCVGASGAIYGVMAAAAFNFPNVKMFIIPFPFPIKLKWLVAGFAAYDMYSGFYSSDGVAHFAHIGGLVVGLAILFFWKYKDGRRRSYSNIWTSSNSYTNNYDKGSKSMTKRVKEAFEGKKSKITIVKNAGERQSDYEYNERKKARNDEIDRILDKVRKGGFETLTEEEKRTLFDTNK